MALVSASDISHSIVAETTFGVTPTATATRYALPTAADQALLKADAGAIASPTKMPNRASNGSRRGMLTVDGSLDVRFMRAPFMDVLLQSALSNTYATKVLKAGTTDSSFSVLSSLQGGAAGAQMVKQFGGCMVNGFTLSAKANEEITSSWDIIGSVAANLTTDNALAVTALPAGTVEFIGSELANITVAGATLNIAELTFETKLDRTRRPILTSNTGLAYGVNGTRETTVTVKAYRESFAIDTAVTGLAQAVSFDIGAANIGYRFNLPAAYGSIPVDELSDGSAFVTISFTAGYDNTAGTDLVVTQL